MPGDTALRPHQDVTSLDAPDRVTSAPSDGRISPLPSALLEVGGPGLRDGGPLYAARDPGQAEVFSGVETSLALPRAIFGHVDRAARVTMEARASDGSPLPSWIKVDTASGRITVAPPAGLTGAVEIRLTARDGGGHSAGATFTIVVRDRQADLPQPFDPSASLVALEDPLEILGLFVAPPLARSTADAGSDPGLSPASPGRAGLSHMLALAALERSPHSLLTAGANAGL